MLANQQLADALDQLEEIVRAVDLVHLTGQAMAHHHGGTKHRPRQLAFGADDFFALMLGSEVEMFVVFGLFKQVLAEHAFVQARSRHRTDMVKMSGLNRLGKLHHVAGAAHVGGNLVFLVDLQAIDRRQVVEEVGDFAFALFGVFSTHGNRPGLTHAPTRR